MVKKRASEKPKQIEVNVLLRLMLFLGENEGSVKIEDVDGTGVRQGKRLLVLRALVDDEWKVVTKEFQDEKTLLAALNALHRDVVKFEAAKGVVRNEGLK